MTWLVILIILFFFTVSLFLLHGQEKWSLNDIETLESLYGLITKHPKICRIISRMIFYRKKGSPGGITGEGKEKEL